MDFTTSRSIPNLAGEVATQYAKLIGSELDLARAELSAKASQAGWAVAMIGIGAVILLPALVILLFAVASLLIRAGFSDPAAYGITGGAAAVIALILLVVGATRLSPKGLKPAATLKQVEQDRIAAMEMMR